MPKPRVRFIYPLSDAQLRLFRDYFRQQYGHTLFYVTDQLIQSLFLEFCDVDDDVEHLHSLVLDVVAMAEDCHVSARALEQMVTTAAKAMRPCPKCHQTGTILPYLNPCPRCLGQGRVPRRSKADA